MMQATDCWALETILRCLSLETLNELASTYLVIIGSMQYSFLASRRWSVVPSNHHHNFAWLTDASRFLSTNRYHLW